MSRNEVRGPSSALSSFLRERGIVAPRSVFQRRNNEPGALSDPNATPAAGSSSAAPAATPASAAETPSSRVGRTRRGASSTAVDESDAELESDEDEIEEEDLESPPRTRSVRGAAATSSKRKAPAAKSKAAAKKRKKGDKDSDDDYDGDAGGAFNPLAPRSNHSKRRGKGKGSPNKDSNGMIRFCERCQRRYMVDDEGSSFCPACLSIQASGKTGAARPKKKKGKMAVDGMGSVMRVKSLKDICIQLIADYIDDVEQFGDISDATKVQIAKIISRDRQLNSKNVRLFTGPMEQRLELFDCSYLDENALAEIPCMCPNLQLLHLGGCGRITDPVLERIGRNCTSLTSLTLKGPFLPANAGFISMFEGLGEKLEELSLQHAAKLSETALTVLVRSCPNLVTLRLDQCGKLGDEGVRLLASLRRLEVLEINRPGKEVSEEALLHLIGAVGSRLRVLSLNGYPNMSDKILVEGISPNCKALRELSVQSCESLTTDGILQFLGNLKTPVGLLSFNLCRNVTITDDAIVALVNDHGKTLTSLNLNGLDELTAYALGVIAKGCPVLQHLDVSWIRNLEDEIFGDLITRCKQLRSIKVYGCSKLTDAALVRRWVNGEGEEVRVVGNEYD